MTNILRLFKIAELIGQIKSKETRLENVVGRKIGGQWVAGPDEWDDEHLTAETVKRMVLQLDCIPNVDVRTADLEELDKLPEILRAAREEYRLMAENLNEKRYWAEPPKVEGKDE